MGIVTGAAAVGSIVFPIALNNLILAVGFKWVRRRRMTSATGHSSYRIPSGYPYLWLHCLRDLASTSILAQNPSTAASIPRMASLH